MIGGLNILLNKDADFLQFWPTDFCQLRTVHDHTRQSKSNIKKMCVLSNVE